MRALGDPCAPPTLSYRGPFTVGSHPTNVVAADFNRDGRMDLAIANQGANTISILIGNGSGGFTPAPIVNIGGGATLQGTVAVDLNADGLVDLATANRVAGNVALVLGNGDGTFAGPTFVPVGDRPVELTAIDADDDGRPDLAVANFSDGNVSVLLGTGGGSLGSATTYTVRSGTQPIGLAVADVNGDQKFDLAVARHDGSSAAVLLGTGTGVFGAPTSFSAGNRPWGITGADLIGDNRPDLAVGSFDGGDLSVYLNGCLFDPTPPDLRLAKSHIGNFTVGTNGVYTLTVSNAATAGPTTGQILSSSPSAPWPRPR